MNINIELNASDESNESPTYELKKSISNCSNCSTKMKILYDYSSFKLCELCNIVFKYDNYTIHKGILCRTDLTQKQIIDLTHKFLKSKKRIPRILEIDPNAKIVDMNFMDVLDSNLNKIKLFFSDMINYDHFSFVSMFARPTKYEPYVFFDVVYKETPKCELS